MIEIVEKKSGKSLDFYLCDWEYFREGSDNIVFKNINSWSFNHDQVLIVPMEK